MSPRFKRADVFGLTLGLYATLSQIVLMREALGVCGGNELTVGLSFFTWLIGVGIGALTIGRLRCPKAALIGGSLAAPLITGSGLMILRLHREILDVSRGVDPSLLGLFGLLATCLGTGGLTVGVLFTAAARSSNKGDKTPVSRLYTTEAVGALLGGLIFTFLLAGRMSHLVVIGLAGSLLSGAITLMGQGREIQFSGGILSILLIFLSTLGPLAHFDQLADMRAFSFIGAAEKFVTTSESAYGRLTLGRSEDQFVLLADGRLDHVFPDPWERPIPMHLALVQHPAPKRVLIIGGGPSDRLTTALSHFPIQVVLTYLDKNMHELCHPFWSSSTVAALGDSRVAVVRDDGRHYVSHTSDRFDVVFVSARIPLSAQANRYHTREFFIAVQKILRPGGSMTILAPGGANILAPEAARVVASELATIRSVFPEVVVVPGIQTILHAATAKGVVTDNVELLEQRYESRGVDTPYFSSKRFATVYDADRIAGVHRQLSGWPAVLNSDFRPLVYLAALQLWEQSLRRERTAKDYTWIGLAEKWAWLWFAFPLALWLIWQCLEIFYRRQRYSAASPIFAIAVTGASGMAAEIVVLYVFQAASGRLYTGLALLIALFMAGLAIGAFLGRRYLASGRFSDGIIADLAMLAFLLFSGPVLSASLDCATIVSGWSLGAGIVVGMAFPALLGMAVRTRLGDERRAAAAIEASDHFGAAAGAFVTGVIWLPVFGITTTCLFFAGFKTASLINLVVSGVKTRN
ncbi:MAG: hypothetical protein GY847_27915 [Proteobacteria bacterium]|nr:hypothetical protein [Pseudomonadota bacterium]